MKVGVVGAGAMGSIFGGLLAHAGHDVWLVDPWLDHVETIRRHGLRLPGPAGSLLVRPQATSDAGEVGPCDLVLVMVKSYHTAAAAPSIPALLGPETVVLTLQNGLGNAETLAAYLGRERVLAGVTYRGAEVLRPGEVRQSGVEKVTLVGELDGPATARVRALATALEQAGIRAIACDDVRRERWLKLLVNVAGNAPGAILRLPLGSLFEVEGARQMVELVLEEATTVARAAGVGLSYPDVLQQVRANWATLREAKSSLHQDLERGRPTEIDALNGAVVREGERLSVPVPYNRALTLLVKALEDRTRLRLQ